MRQVLGLVFASLAFGFLAVALIRLLQADQTVLISGAHKGLLGMSILGVLGLIGVMSEIWRRLVQQLGAGLLTPAAGLNLHILGWLGRYIPGKLVGMLGKVMLAEARGLKRTACAAAALYEQIYFFAVGAALSGVLLLPLPAWGAALTGLAIFPAIACSLWFGLPMITPILNKLGRQRDVLPRLDLRSHLILTAAYLLPHLLVGLGFWLMLVAVGHGHIGPLRSIAYLTAAHVAGMAVFLAPAGVGAREAALTLLLARHVGMDLALAIAALTRLWATAGDGLAGIYCLYFRVLRRS